jgi:hypothetical protein
MSMAITPQTAPHCHMEDDVLKTWARQRIDAGPSGTSTTKVWLAFQHDIAGDFSARAKSFLRLSI